MRDDDDNSNENSDYNAINIRGYTEKIAALSQEK